MAYADRTYPVLTKVVSSRRIVMSAANIYRGQKVMLDDSDSGQAARAMAGDAADRFVGIAMETVRNASDALGDDGDVYIEVCDEGEFIAELDATPEDADLHDIVYTKASTDEEQVSKTDTNGSAIGIIKAWTNVSDPLGRTNAVLVKFPWTEA